MSLILTVLATPTVPQMQLPGFACLVPFWIAAVVCVTVAYCARLRHERLRQDRRVAELEELVANLATRLKTASQVLSKAAERRPDIMQPQPGSLADAFQSLRDAGGSGWDKIDDPQAFLDGTDEK